MATRQRKAEKHRKKRQQKVRKLRVSSALHERRATSDDFPLYACMVNKGWEEDKEASLFMARTIAPGRVTLAAFLVDTMGMGLKDAWGRADVPASEFTEALERAGEGGVSMQPLNLGVAKHLVYGGIDLANRMGFRLPRRYERWTNVLGPLPDGEAPDMSLFYDDGRIHVMCSRRDLEARLVGCSVASFLRRTDIGVTIMDGDFSLVDDEAEEAEDFRDSVVESLVAAARQWCFANQQEPHELLPVVVAATMEAAAESLPEDADPALGGEALTDAACDAAAEQAIDCLIGVLKFERRDVEPAMAQFMAFMSSAETPEEFLKTIDFGPE